jgi:hypothetical protein
MTHTLLADFTSLSDNVSGKLNRDIVICDEL